MAEWVVLACGFVLCAIALLQACCNRKFAGELLRDHQWLMRERSEVLAQTALMEDAAALMDEAGAHLMDVVAHAREYIDIRSDLEPDDPR